MEDVNSRVKAVAEWFDLAPRHGPCQKMHLSETELNLVPAAAQPKTSVVVEVSSSWWRTSPVEAVTEWYVLAPRHGYCCVLHSIGP